MPRVVRAVTRAPRAAGSENRRYVTYAPHPWWPDALRLRRWDDEVQVAGRRTRALSAWEPLSWEPLLRKYFAELPAAH